MRKLIFLLVASVTVVGHGANLTQAYLGKKAVQGVVAARPEASPEAFPENLTGEVVSVDTGSRQLTVKPSGGATPGEVTFAVAEPAVPVLAGLRPGDRISVGYVRAHGHLIARAINKVPAEHISGN